MLIIAVVYLVVILSSAFALFRGYLRIGTLAGHRPLDGSGQPPVSVIVPACNEEETIEAGLRSLAGQDYRNLEIIVVNDRSTDGTAEVVNRIKKDIGQIRLVTIGTLPDGWLGKPHALQAGAREAQGEYYLFADADVCMAESTISRAVQAMETQALDHLCLIFRNSGGGALLNALIAEIGAALLLVFKPWRASEPTSRYFVGVGAFNMVRTSAYWAIGGHESIRMQVIDDVFLGRQIKQRGFRQNCLLALEFVEIPWYPTLERLIDGLMKNAYAFFNYRPYYALAGILLIIGINILPLWLIFWTEGYLRFLFITIVLGRIVGFSRALPDRRLMLRSLPCFIITPYLCVYIIVRAVWTTHCQGGIRWRGSFYQLEILKKNEWIFSGFFRIHPY